MSGKTFFRWGRLFAAAAAEKIAHTAVLIRAVADKKQRDRQAVATVEDSVKTAVFCEKDYQ